MADEEAEFEEIEGGAGAGYTVTALIPVEATGRAGAEEGEEALRYRHDGFTAKKRRQFLKALEKTGCVRDACRKVGISSTTAYRVRERLPEFGRHWDLALAKASVGVELLAWERAVEGVEEPVFAYGKMIGTKVKKSDSILRLLLQGADKEKYGRQGAVANKAAIEEEVQKRLAVEREKMTHELRGKASTEELTEALLSKLEALNKRLMLEDRRGGKREQAE